MVLAVGLSQYTLSVFHLVNHAYFYWGKQIDKMQKNNTRNSLDGFGPD